MNAKHETIRRIAGYTAVFSMSILLLAGCGDGDNGMVRVMGRVVNVDTGVPAENVVVFLLDGPQYLSPVTSADGEFFLEVPRGSQFALVTNDWGGLDRDAVTGSGVADHYLTFINVEPTIPEIKDDLQLVLHACPTAGSPYTWDDGREGLGSVAIWRNFLDNSTLAADFTDATDVDGKIVAGFFTGTPPNEELGVSVGQITGFSVSAAEAGFGTTGYWSVWNCFNVETPGLEGQEVQDASVGPDIFGAGRTVAGPGLSLWTIFGNAGYTGDTVTLIFNDPIPERAIDFSSVSPVEIPLRERATTWVVLGSVDNQVTPLLEGLCSLGYVTGPMCGD